MAVFISYARRDAEAAQQLVHDLSLVAGPVWYDQQLAGGQVWWDEILSRIRSCDIFVFTLSTASLRSEACLAELDYALQVGRLLVAVRVDDAELAIAPESVRRTQIVDFQTRTADTALALLRSIQGVSPRPLPQPLPASPPPPESYGDRFADVFAESLSLDQQMALFARLEQDLEYSGRSEDVTHLLGVLGNRHDIALVVRRKVEGIVAVSEPIAPSAFQLMTPTDSIPTSRTAAPVSIGQAVITRRRNLLIKAAISLSVSLDGKSVGKLKNGTSLQIEAAQGAHQILIRTSELAVAAGNKLWEYPLEWNCRANITDKWFVQVPAKGGFLVTPAS